MAKPRVTFPEQERQDELQKHFMRDPSPRGFAIGTTVISLSDQLLAHIISFKPTTYTLEDARFSAAVVREMLSRKER